MAKVIVPKNYTTNNIINSGIISSNILTNFVDFSCGVENSEYNTLGVDITINYNLSDKIVSISEALTSKCIIIKNNSNFNCNFAIFKINGLPSFRNTATDGNLVIALVLELLNGSSVILKNITIPKNVTGYNTNVNYRLNGTYYVDLVNGNVTTISGEAICNKAIIPANQFWHSDLIVYNVNSTSTQPEIYVRTARPSIFHNVEIIWNSVSDIYAEDIVISLANEQISEQTNDELRYLKLKLTNSPNLTGTSIFGQRYKLLLNVIKYGNTEQIVLSEKLVTNSSSSNFDGIYYVDLINSVVIDANKAITHI